MAVPEAGRKQGSAWVRLRGTIGTWGAHLEGPVSRELSPSGGRPNPGRPGQTRRWRRHGAPDCGVRVRRLWSPGVETHEEMATARTDGQEARIRSSTQRQQHMEQEETIERTEREEIVTINIYR